MRIWQWNEATEDGTRNPNFDLTFEGMGEINGLATAVRHRLNVVHEGQQYRFPYNIPFSETAAVRGILRALPTRANRETKRLHWLDDLAVRAAYNHDDGGSGEPRLRLLGDESRQALVALREYAAVNIPEGTHFLVEVEHQLVGAMVRQADEEISPSVAGAP
ncbi:hypothetical protein EYC59_04035 [Candidatus Saccharibacteria bacterium]|nr:MAG: hypothetical protein EYC59_04035 [Candidatus Saccharibacteria bacterium]